MAKYSICTGKIDSGEIPITHLSGLLQEYFFNQKESFPKAVSSNICATILRWMGPEWDNIWVGLLEKVYSPKFAPHNNTTNSLAKQAVKSLEHLHIILPGIPLDTYHIQRKRSNHRATSLHILHQCFYLFTFTQMCTFLAAIVWGRGEGGGFKTEISFIRWMSKKILKKKIYNLLFL